MARITLCGSSFSAALSPPDRTSNQLNRCFFMSSMNSTSLSKLGLETKSQSTLNSIADVKELKTKNHILACPICHEKMIGKDDSSLSMDSVHNSSFQCNTCKKGYSANETYIDLTIARGMKEYGEVLPAFAELFRLPLVSFIYERGWRQSFIAGGYPGPEIEFELIKDYLKPVLGGNIIDASCGSGLFSRLFAKSGLFSLVVALDYSENMLQQCYEFVKQENQNFPKEDLILVRADISRLPFATSSIDAVHAGAALHCWPSPSAAVAEISRVLRPGGVFVASTGLLDGPFAALPFIRPLRNNLRHLTGGSIFLAEEELEGLCSACGLVDFTCTRNERFIMISAIKPN